jgi:hypothetical protein
MGCLTGLTPLNCGFPLFISPLFFPLFMSDLALVTTKKKKTARKGGDGARERRRLSRLLAATSLIKTLPTIILSALPSVNLSLRPKKNRITMSLHDFHRIIPDPPMRPSSCSHPYDLHCDLYPHRCPLIIRRCTHAHWQDCIDYYDRHRYVLPDETEMVSHNRRGDDNFEAASQRFMVQFDGLNPEDHDDSSQYDRLLSF